MRYKREYVRTYQKDEAQELLSHLNLGKLPMSGEEVELGSEDDGRYLMTVGKAYNAYDILYEHRTFIL